ncbi:hypothetical protein BHE74_00040996, partial [Ensete ventricosum]
MGATDHPKLRIHKGSNTISLATAREEEASRTSTRPNLAPLSLDDPDPGGNSEATARLNLHPVLRRRLKMPMAFVSFFIKGRRRLRPSTSSSSAAYEEKTASSSSKVTRRRGESDVTKAANAFFLDF